PEAATEIAHVASENRSASAPPAARSADGKIDTIGQGEPVDALKHEGEAEAELQLDDHRRLVAPDRDDVTAADLRLDVVALTFEEGLDRRIQIALGAQRPATWHPRDST